MNTLISPQCNDIQCTAEGRQRTISVPINNMEEYRDLIRTIESKQQELNKLIEKLKNFEVKMEIKF